MSMRTVFARGMGLALAFAVMVSGCVYADGNDFGDWGDGDGASQGTVGVCFAFCGKLAECGTIPNAAQDACVTQCHEQHAFTPALTEQGASCVVEQSCKAVSAYDCPGAPFPPPSAGDGAGGASPGDPPASCQADCDCPSGDQCVGGTCQTPCNASCECAAGESCVGGYCELPMDPPITCQVDCDCPSGKVCSEGVCI